MPIIQKMVLTLLGIALLPVFFIGVVFYLNARASLHSQVINQLATIATIQQGQTENLIEQNNELLASFTSQLPLLTTLDQYNRSRSHAAQSLLNLELTQTQGQVKSYQAISVLSSTGEAVASTQPSAVGKSFADQAYFTSGRVKNDVTSYMFLDGNGHPAIYLVGPLKLDGRLVGVAVIEATADSLLASAKAHTGLGATGETMLVKRDEQGNALYLTPLRFDRTAALHRTVSRTETQSSVMQALASQDTISTSATDYRGQPVLAITRHIAAANWGLVVKIDQAEAYQPLAELSNLLLVTMLIFSVVIVFTAFYLARRFNEPILTLAVVADRIRAGDLSQRAHVSTKDEIGQLASTFNAMARNFEKIDQMKSEFVLLTSHQLRTPATAVKGFLSMLLDNFAGKITPDQKKLVNAAYAENERQISVINSILDVAKMEAGEMVLVRKTYDIGQLIKASARGQGPLLEAHHQHLVIDQPKQPVKLWLDGEKLQLVVDNLIHNAIKYSPADTTIRVELTSSPDHTTIRVQDEGIGIARKDMSRLFKRFSRISGPQTANIQGAGLGLYLANKLIAMHDGTISVHSQIGKGTTFTIELPNVSKED